MRSRRVWLTRTLILVEITRITRTSPGVSEYKETEPMQAHLRYCASNANQEKDYESSNHLVPCANLPALRLRGRPGLRRAPGTHARPRRWPGRRPGSRLSRLGDGFRGIRLRPGRCLCGWPGSCRRGRWLGRRLGGWTSEGKVFCDVRGHPAQLGRHLHGVLPHLGGLLLSRRERCGGSLSGGFSDLGG